jgi:hypothetical protein
VIAVVTAIFQITGGLSLLLFHKEDYGHLQAMNSDTEEKKSTSFLETLKVFTQLSFWCLLWGFFVGVSSGVLVLTNASQVSKPKKKPKNH